MRGLSMWALAGALTALGVGGAASPAVANPLGVDFTTPPSTTGSCAPTLECNGFLTYGYSFTTGASPVIVFGLGTFDDGSLANLGSAPTTVGLWINSTQTLVTPSVQVDSSSFQVGLWAFTALPTPVTLAPDTSYVVGSQGFGAFLAGSFDPEFLHISVNSLIAYNGGQSSDPKDGSVFEFPGIASTASFNPGFFGGNIDLAPIPEPMSLSLFGAALAGLGILRRRKKA